MSHNDLANARASSKSAKSRLIQSTIDSLMADGIEGSSVRKICERANVSIGLVNYHFESNNHLIAAAYRKLASEFLLEAQSAMKQESDLREQLTCFLDEIFGPKVMRKRVLRAWVVFWGLIDSSKAVKKAHETSNSDFSRFLESKFTEYQFQHELRVSPRLCAAGLTAMIDGLWLEFCLNDTSFTAAECVEICEAWIDGLAKQ